MDCSACFCALSNSLCLLEFAFYLSVEVLVSADMEDRLCMWP